MMDNRRRRPPRRRNPWWIPPFLGRVPEGVEPAHLRVLGFVALAMFFENYDLGMLGNALPQIAATFGLDKAAQGEFTAMARFGALPAFLLLPFADRIGRRRILLLSIAGMSLGALATALAQSPLQFVVGQFAMRTFIVTAAITSFVVVSEEFPARRRGWGIGMLGGVGAIGFGFGALLYGFIEWLPFGWRALYAVGIVPLAFAPMFARGLRETERFAALRAAAETGVAHRRARRDRGAGAALPAARARDRADRLSVERRHRPVVPVHLRVPADRARLEPRRVRGAHARVRRVRDRGQSARGLARRPLRPSRRRRGRARAVPARLARLLRGPGRAGGAAVDARWCSSRWRTRSACARSPPSSSPPRCAARARAASRCSRRSAWGRASCSTPRRSSAFGSQEVALPLVSLGCLGAAASMMLVPETAGRELEEVAAS